MFVTYSVVGNSFNFGKPQVWSPTPIDVTLNASLPSPYDIHADSKRLVVASAPDLGTVVQDKIVLVSNFFDYLRKIAPGPK